MRKMKNSKGFTLMEMLIVVAIIAILVAIMIPVMTSQLERARETADLANLRSAYAEASVNALSDTTGAGKSNVVTFTQTKADWQYLESSIPTYMSTATGWDYVKGLEKGGQVVVSVDQDGKVTFAAPTTTPGNGG